MRLVSTLLFPILFFQALGCARVSYADNCEGMRTASEYASVPASGVGISKLTGCFLQFDDRYHSRNPQFWDKIVADSNKAGMRLLIVQYVKMLQQDPAVAPKDFTSDLDDLMSAAKRFNQQHPTQKTLVMIGLSNCVHERWSGVIASDETKTTDLLSKLTAANSSIISHIQSNYATSTSFGGFYIPLELWPFCKFLQGGEHPIPAVTDATLEKLRLFLRNTRDKCKAIAPSAFVTASVYFNPWQYMDWVGPSKTYAMYKNIIFRDTKLSAVMLQDGIGTRIVESSNVSGKLKDCGPRALELVEQYFAAFHDACEQNNIELWDVVEVFSAAGDDPARNSSDPWIDWNRVVPASTERVSSQLAFMKSRKAQIKRGVAFEYLHYLDEGNPQCKPLYEFLRASP